MFETSPFSGAEPTVHGVVFRNSALPAPHLAEFRVHGRDGLAHEQHRAGDLFEHFQPFFPGDQHTVRRYDKDIGA